MLKIVIAFLLAVQATTAIRDHSFLHKFEHIQTVSKCFGDGVSQMWFEMVSEAAQKCYGEPLKQIWTGDMLGDLSSLLGSDQSVAHPETISQLDVLGTFPSLPFLLPVNSLASEQKRASQLGGPLLQGMVAKAVAKISNFTCVMQKVKLIDEEYNIMVDDIKQFLIDAKLNPVLLQANIWQTEYCFEVAMGVPDQEILLPIGIQRAVAFLNCDKDLRIMNCMKQDLLRYYLGVPDLNKEDVLESHKEEIKLSEKLLQLLWVVEAKDDFEVY